MGGGVAEPGPKGLAWGAEPSGRLSASAARWRPPGLKLAGQPLGGAAAGRAPRMTTPRNGGWLPTNGGSCSGSG